MIYKTFKSAILLSTLIGAQLCHAIDPTCNTWDFSGTYPEGTPSYSCLASGAVAPVQPIDGGTQVSVNMWSTATIPVACKADNITFVPYKVYIDASHGPLECGPSGGSGEMNFNPGSNEAFTIACYNASDDSTPITITVGQIDCSGSGSQIGIQTGQGVTWNNNGD